MKRILLGTLALVLIFALTGWATNTRVMTLGDANNIVKDEANIWLYPSTINMYPNMALGEFGSQLPTGWDFETLGMHYSFGETDMVFGLYLDRVNNDDNMYYPNVLDPDGLNADVDHRINLFFGTPMGDNQFGAALSYWGDSFSVDGDTADERTTSNMRIDFSAGLTLNENLDLALGFGFQTWTNEDAAGETIDEPKGNMHFGLNGRYWMDFGGDYVGIPHFSFLYAGQGMEVPDSGEVKFNHMAFDLGWGMNLNPDERILAVGDLGFTYVSEKTTVSPTGGTDVELTDSDFILPYFRLGLEGKVTNWWDVRVGAMKRWHMCSEAQSEDIDWKYGYAETTTYLGSGIYLGNMTLDVQIDPGFVQQGPNFVSGYVGNIANRVSLKYNW